MERIFDTFREASQEAEMICRKHATKASLERRGSRFAVVFDHSLPDGALPLAEPDPLALENDLLRANLSQIQHDFASLTDTHKRLQSRIALFEQEHALVKPLLVRDTPSPFAQTVLNKMPKENVDTILRYEYLCVLSNLGAIDQIAFNDFKIASLLWIAIYNYEKIKVGPKPSYVPEYPRLNVEYCTSCGVVVINGHCKCSG